jgi:hypothetical protein
MLIAGFGCADAQRVSIDQFSANPQKINPGVATVLSWRTRNAVRCTIDKLPGIQIDLPDGTAPPAFPKQTTPYMMTCDGPDGPARDTTTVTVQPPPQIRSLTADPTTIGPSETTKLNWSTAFADTCKLWPGAEDVAPNPGTPISKSPQETTTYSLQCDGVGPPAADSVVVTVSEVKITSFTATPPQPVDPGSKVELSWKVENATGDCMLAPGLGPVPGHDGSREVHPSTTTTYTLSCPGGGGPAQASVEVKVKPVIISSFAADPPGPLAPGTRITLNWTLEAASGDCDLGPDLGKVPGRSGSKGDVPVARTTTFTLSCPGEGGPAVKTTTVQVPDVRIDSFAAQPSEINPNAPFRLTWQVAYAAGDCTIQPGDHKVPGQPGELPLSGIAADTIFTMDCPGVGNPAIAQTHLKIFPLDIASFTATPANPVNPGDEVVLAWNTTGATKCTIDGGDPLRLPDGSTKINPQVCKTHHLECSGNGMPQTRSVKVQVANGLCIKDLSAPSWGIAQPDNEVQITWIVDLAKDNKCSLSGTTVSPPRSVPTRPVDQAFATVPLNYGWNTFVLTCDGRAVGKDSASVYICGILQGPPPPPGECPTAGDSHGRMGGIRGVRSAP